MYLHPPDHPHITAPDFRKCLHCNPPVHGLPLLMRRVGGAVTSWRPEEAEELCQLAALEGDAHQLPARCDLTRYQLFSRLIHNIYSPKQRLPLALRGWFAQMTLILLVVGVLGSLFLLLLLYQPTAMET